MARIITGWPFIFRQLFSRFFEDRLEQSAAALGFITLITIVPLLALSIKILSVSLIFHAYRFEIQRFIVQNFIPATGHLIGQYIQDFVRGAGRLSFWGMLVLTVTTLLTMFSFERVFNDIWKVKKRYRSILKWLRYWILLASAPIFISISIAAVSYVISLPLIVETAQVLGLKGILFKGVPLSLTVLLFTLLYVVIPGCHVPIKYGFIGALVSTILLDIAKRIFVFYILHFSEYHLIYGALAAVPLFLIWVYMLWVIILFGVLISNVLTINSDAYTLRTLSH
ncbi:MAG: YihY family inner membrane protein [Gammaproteobacteria bacterium]|nr:YihY family inner membrane protein [Gammaproteobacteria bacterium]